MIEESENTKQLRASFDDFYNRKLLPLFAELEKERRRYLTFFILGLAIMFVVLPALMLLLFWIFVMSDGGGFHYEGEVPAGGIMFFILIAIVIVATPILKYQKKAKNRIMPEFIKFFGSFTYQYQKTVNDSLWEKSKLVGAYNRHSGDDYFCGVYNDTTITISEERLLMHTRNGKHSSTSTVFDGIALILSMKKNFQGQTVVFKDWGMFNGFHSLGNLFNSLKKVTLEDSVFEKEFEVYSDDQLEARYLLTTAFMERMLKVREAFKGKKIQFSFFDNMLFIAIDTNENMFETTSLFTGCTRKKMVDRAFEQFLSVLSIADTLQTGRKNSFS